MRILHGLRCTPGFSERLRKITACPVCEKARTVAPRELVSENSHCACAAAGDRRAGPAYVAENVA